MITFESKFKKVGNVELPTFTGTRVMMMPVMIGDPDSLPDDLSHYKKTFDDLCKLTIHQNKVGYLTIDEKLVKANSTHRRSGLHVDGVFQGKPAGPWGGGGGWGSTVTGMLTVASMPGCRAWNQKVEGSPGWEGECDHLKNQLKDENSVVFGINEVYWVDGLCIHESLPMTVDSNRQFVRLSLPSNAPWFEGYAVNPKGILPTGPILPRRIYMDS